MKSDTHKELLKKRVGYRYEAFRGSGVRDLKEILLFETQELQNLDVFYYVKENYGLLDDFKLDNHTLLKLMETSSSLEETLIEEDEILFNIGINNAKKFVNEIMEYVRKEVGKSNPEGLWLTDKESASKYKIENDGVVLIAIPKRSIVLSDLSKDGCLFAY